MKNKSLLVVLAITLVAALGIGIFLRTQKGINITNQSKNENSQNAPVKINKVLLTKNGFEPLSITIKKGETVMWINQSQKNATVNSNPYPTNNLYPFLNLGEFPPGNGIQTIFKEAGSYSYHNEFIPEQQGTIVVK